MYKYSSAIRRSIHYSFKGIFMITLKLSIAEINAILQSLGDSPYIKVADVIQNIRSQAAPQVQNRNEMETETENTSFSTPETVSA